MTMQALVSAGVAGSLVDALLGSSLSPGALASGLGAREVALFVAVTLLCSNVFSNVPFVIIVLSTFGPSAGAAHGLCGGGGAGGAAMPQPTNTTATAGTTQAAQPGVFLFLLLSWASTVAGNLTLPGSIANLIVAEKALQSEARYELGFGEHLLFGFPSTLVLAVVGAALLVAVVPQ